MPLINKSITFFQKEIKNLTNPNILNSSVLFDKLFQMQVSIQCQQMTFKIYFKYTNMQLCDFSTKWRRNSSITYQFIHVTDITAHQSYWLPLICIKFLSLPPLFLQSGHIQYSQCSQSQSVRDCKCSKAYSFGKSYSSKCIA